MLITSEALQLATSDFTQICICVYPCKAFCICVYPCKALSFNHKYFTFWSHLLFDIYVNNSSHMCIRKFIFYASVCMDVYINNADNILSIHFANHIWPILFMSITPEIFGIYVYHAYAHQKYRYLPKYFSYVIHICFLFVTFVTVAAKIFVLDP